MAALSQRQGTLEARLATLNRQFGFPGLTLPLDLGSLRRAIWASILPLVVVSAHLIALSLGLIFPGSALAFGDWLPSNPVPDVWYRVNAVATAIGPSAGPPAVAALLLFAFSRWSRAEGSWMFVIGAALLIAAFGLVTATAMIYQFADPRDLRGLQPDRWARIGRTLAFLSVGYFFVACRAAAIPRRPRPWRRRRWVRA